MNIIYSSLRNVHFYLQAINWVPLRDVVDIVHCVKFITPWHFESWVYFCVGAEVGRVIMLYKACVKELMSVSEPQGQSGSIHLPHFHLKMETGPFFLNIMMSDNGQHPDIDQAYYNIVSSESVKANFFGCPPLKVQFLYLNRLSETQIVYRSNR